MDARDPRTISKNLLLRQSRVMFKNSNDVHKTAHWYQFPARLVYEY